jgi:hypothetical protein
MNAQEILNLILHHKEPAMSVNEMMWEYGVHPIPFSPQAKAHQANLDRNCLKYGRIERLNGGIATELAGRRRRPDVAWSA